MGHVICACPNPQHVNPEAPGLQQGDGAAQCCSPRAASAPRGRDVAEEAAHGVGRARARAVCCTLLRPEAAPTRTSVRSTGRV